MSLRLYSFLFFSSLFVLLSSCSSSPQISYENLSPEEVVGLYYTSLDAQDYRTMYALLSQGFKDKDSHAGDLDSFSSYMKGFFVGASGVTVSYVHEVSNEGSHASVDYGIILQGKEGNETLPFESTYTLKKQEDGWKLIHPYGDTIDTT